MIETTDLSFGYGAKQVLDGISLRFENAQVTGLIGVNGAGKSTLIKLMARILKPDKGTVTVDDWPAEGCPSFAAARDSTCMHCFIICSLAAAEPTPRCVPRSSSGWRPRARRRYTGS